MIPYAWMGWLALGVLWVNTLLVCAAACKRAFRLFARARELVRLRPGEFGIGVLAATIEDGSPAFEVDQTGRAGTGERRWIVWHDRAYRSSVDATEVKLADGQRFRIDPSPDAQVWISSERLTQAHVCPSAEEFNASYPDAVKARGVRRTTRAQLGRGDKVFVAGEFSKTADGELVVRAHQYPLLVSEVDPRSFASGRAATICFLSIPAMLLGAALCTALALVPPVLDGWVSKAGGLLGLIFFLLVLPAGTALADYARLPHERILRGKWLDPTGTG